LIALFSSSLKTTEPLEKLIERYISNEIIDSVGDAYRREGRLLLVGTVDVDSGAFVTWDMTRLAASTEPSRYDLYRKLLLAAASIPVLFPPVVIDGAMHVDGGVREQVFGAVFSDAANRAYNAFRESVTSDERLRAEFTRRPAAYFIVNGQLIVEKQCVKAKLLPIALRSISVMLAEGMIGNIYKAKTIMANWEFNLSRIPDDYQLESGSEEFEEAKMRRLFSAGHQWGKAHQWEHEIPPPGVSPWPCIESK